MPFIKDQGIGVGLRPEHMDHFINGRPSSVSWVELIAENFIDWESRKNESAQIILEKIRAHSPVALHGVSLSIGSADDLNFNHLRKIKRLIDQSQPLWFSEHLCWTGVDQENAHDLLPLPYTSEAIEHIVKKIKQTQDFLERKILLENVSSYMEYGDSQMKEWEFIKYIAEEADCGILLDVSNVYVSSINHQFDPLTFMKALPKERVGQFHLAGFSRKPEGYLIDTHDAPIDDEVWKLYAWAREWFGPVSSMVERDDNIPDWKTLEEELIKMAAIRRTCYETR